MDGGEPELVEPAVQLIKIAGGQVSPPDGLRHAVPEEPQALELQLVVLGAEILQHEGLHRQALVDDLVDDVQVHPGDEGPPVGLHRHQPAKPQLLEHAADGGPGHPEPGAQGVLAEELAGLQLQTQNLGLQGLENLPALDRGRFAHLRPPP